MADDLQAAIDVAVTAAQDAYEDEPNNPMDHGFAHIEGLDGRTTLARELRDHPQVDASDSDYVTVSGMSRYLSPQQSGYRAFIDVLDDEGVDVSDLYVRGRLD
jgi:hypothetical protein